MKKLLWLGLSLLAACSKSSPPVDVPAVAPNAAPAVSSTPAPAPEPPLPPANAIDLLSLFGAQIERATDVPANELRGDFTGDGIEDRAFVVKSSTFQPSLPPDIQILRPFKTPMARIPDLRQGSPVSLVLVIGGPNFPVATYIVYDESSPGRIVPAIRLGLRLVKHADLADTAVAELAKGDAVVLPGAAGAEDCFYWDGAMFRFAPLRQAGR